MSQSNGAVARGVTNTRVGLGAVTVIGLVSALTLTHFAQSRAHSAAPLPVSSAPQIATLKATTERPVANAEARRALGKRIFFDKNLSSPAGTSCASCHDPARGYAGNNGSKVGVPLGSRAGHFAARNTPSVMYLKFVKRFRMHWEEDMPLVDAYGGFFWDGRVDDLADVPKQPLLNPDEMNNASVSDIASKVSNSDYAPEFEREFGKIPDPEAAVHAVGEALAAYLLSPELAPFSSKYDRYVRHELDLSAQEARGLRLFKDSAKGGCGECHKLSDTSGSPERSPFTDFAFEAVGVPRNAKLPANADPAHFDLGLCARANAKFHSDSPEFCGAFRTPSLRNVALRESFMHNGAFTSLRDVVAFYASRSVTPKRWYRDVEFNDLPKEHRQNVNVDKAPYNHHAGDKPALTENELDDIVAFLGTLSDAPPSAPALP